MSAENPETEDPNNPPSRNSESPVPETEEAAGIGDLERPAGDRPDLLLDVPQLNVDEIDLEVKDLQARVALNAEVADLVKINVGVTVHLDEVKLNVKGLEARALLEVKMERVLETLNRALEAIDSDPGILLDRPSRQPRTDAEEGTGQPGPARDTATDEASERPAATEAATGRARELGVDLRNVKGTGSGGRVVVRDVQRAAREGA